MNLKKISSLIVLGILTFLICPIGNVSAQLYRPASPVDLAGLARNIETAIWVVFGGIAVICFVIAGILFLTAMGNPEKLKIARDSLWWGVAGVIVGILAYSIVAIITKAIT